MKLFPFMTMRRPSRRTVILVLSVVFLVCLTYALERQRYIFFPWSTRTVEMNHGRFLLELPAGWSLTSKLQNEYRFSDFLEKSILIVRVNYAPRQSSANERREVLRQPPNQPAFQEISPGRFYRTLPAKMKIENDEIDLERHELIFFGRTASWFMTADWWVPPRGDYIPSRIAYHLFFLRELKQVQMRVAPNPERNDEWTIAAIELGKAQEQLDTSSITFFWTVVAFLLTWFFAHMILERVMRLDKVGYSWVGQAATLISAGGIFLAAFLFFMSKSDYRNQIAQVAADSEISRALDFYEGLSADCKDWARKENFDFVLTPSPELSSVMGTKFDCNVLQPYTDAMVEAFNFLHYDLIKKGDFVDPYYRLGFPITYLIASIRGLAFRVHGLSDEQRDVLAERSLVYLARLELVLRTVQAQSSIIDSAETMTLVSRYWSILLAISAAMNMVKLTADRRFEREKSVTSAGASDKAANIQERTLGQLDTPGGSQAEPNNTRPQK